MRREKAKLVPQRALNGAHHAVEDLQVAAKKYIGADQQKILLAHVVGAAQDFFSGDADQLDGHAANIALCIGLSRATGVGKPHPGRIGSCLFKNTCFQCGRNIGMDDEFSLHQAVHFRVRVARHQPVRVLVDQLRFETAQQVVGVSLLKRGDAFLWMQRHAWGS